MSRRSSRIATRALASLKDTTNEQRQLTSTPSSSAISTTKKRKGPTKTKVGAKRNIMKRSPSSSPSPSPSRKSRSSPKKKKFDPKPILCSSDLEKISPENPWMDLQVPPQELRPSATLTTGQCFNWIVVHDDRNYKGMSQPSSAWGTFNETEWVGPVQNMIISIREAPDTTLYRVLHVHSHDPLSRIITSSSDMSKFLTDYFQLDTELAPLYQSWSESDERLAKISHVIPGLRILRQDPIECLFSFICSSNNNIPRITKILKSVRERYGDKMLDLPQRLLESEDGDDDGKDEVSVSAQTLETPVSIYSFPTLDQLKPSTEAELREIGLGYRAKYIIQTRDLLIKNGGEEYLQSLRQKNAETVQEELLQFSGIGRKVADCVALFSLDQCEAIPVDVHVQHIASRDFDPTVLEGAKSLTPTIYKKVAKLFQDRFEYAGWAHSLLFAAELPSFRNVLPEDVVAEMDMWKEAEAAKKTAEKKAKQKISK